MARKYNYYYFRNTVSIWIRPRDGLEVHANGDLLTHVNSKLGDDNPNPPAPPPTTQIGFDFTGIRLEETLYKDTNLRRLLGMDEKHILARQFPDTTFQTINTFSDSSRLGIGRYPYSFPDSFVGNSIAALVGIAFLFGVKCIFRKIVKLFYLASTKSHKR